MVQTKKSHRCQCDPSCQNAPLEGSPFCQIHAKQCSRKAPLSGSEPDYNPRKYNKHKGIKESHNCFSYAFDFLKLPKKCTLDSCPVGYPQPGRASGYPSWSKIKGKRCPDLVSRFMGDVSGIIPSTFEGKCPKGTRKIASVTDEDEDYHFYRQDSNGMWSHKPGATDVSNLDALKRLIYDPQLASRLYPGSGLHYDNFCGYSCVPVGKPIHIKRGGLRSVRSKQSKRSKYKTRRHLRSK